MKKLWLVSKEVLATSLEEALKVKKGRVYRIEEASKEYQPEEIKKVGFSNGPKKSKKIE